MALKVIPSSFAAAVRLKRVFSSASLIAARYLDRVAPDWGVERPQLAQGAIDALMAYEFPGNVRELENILERAVALCDENLIEAEDLRLGSGAGPAAAEEDLRVPGLPAPPAAMRQGSTPASLDAYMDTLERDAINKALQETRYNKTAAAKKLGITFRALRYKLKKLGID